MIRIEETGVKVVLSYIENLSNRSELVDVGEIAGIESAIDRTPNIGEFFGSAAVIEDSRACAKER
jgi:hypothetical protein